MDPKTQETINTAIAKIEADAYKRGLEAGLMVAEKIAGYLTAQPQTQIMRTVEAWAKEDLAKARQT